MDRKIIDILKYALRAFGILLLATIVSLLLDKAGIGKESVLLVFLLGVLLTAMYTRGYFYGIVTSVVSIIIFNYFFTVPVRTFRISDKNDVTLMFFFLLAAVIASSMTARFQSQWMLTKRKERVANLLYEMSEAFINVTGEKNIIELGKKYVYDYSGCECEVVLEGTGQKEKAGQGGVFKNYMLYPITGVDRMIGQLKIVHYGQEFTEEQKLLIKTTANQIGIALDREFIYREQEQIKVAIEKEHMKSSMLRSISHDLRTPLTGIIGDCDLILETREGQEPVVRQMAGEIKEQAEWLAKMVENILNMTRLEEGRLQIHKKTEVIDDIISEAASHVIDLREHRRFKVSLPDDVIVIQADGKMLVQVIMNLLDNAMKHTGEDGMISVEATFSKDRIWIRIEDDGDGIPEAMLDQIFEEFVSLSDGQEDKKRGIGLGLTICRAVIEMHGGEIWAENRKPQGARFVFWLPAQKGETDGE